jgi:ubiquinone/menaquinone biosynthesis C-methylase UbiE
MAQVTPQTVKGGHGGNDDAAIRAGIHGMWGAVAPAWDKHAEYVDARAAEATARMLELAELKPGDRVLELACGPGGLGLEAAPLVNPGGEVVLSDAAREMAAVAERRARALGLDNVRSSVLDLEAIDERDEVFDAVLCREGLMFALDPARALGEVRRILRPGGRFVAAVWGPRERNPWLAIVLDSASEALGAPVPPPGIPGPFALEDAGRLARLIAAAGLDQVSMEERPVTADAPDFEDWWSRTCELTGPLAMMLRSLPDDARASLNDRARSAARAYKTDRGLRFPGLTLIATARRR